VALLQRGAGGASLRVGRLAPSSSSAGWGVLRYVHLALLPLPGGLEGQPQACHVIDGPTLLLALPVRPFRLL
jgi:hypothetical protein